MSVKLEWGAPPPEAVNPRLGAGFYGQVAVELRKRPNEWAQIPREFSSAESAKSAAANIRNGRMKAMPAGEFEAVTAETKLWVRFVGEEDEAAEGGEGGGESKPEDEDRPGSRHLRRVGAAPLRQYDPVKVRAWAAREGIEVSKHGRLPAELISNYEEAMAAQES